MSDTKSGKVLKKEEVEKGNFGTVVELPYVQVVDEEAEANTQEEEVTVKLPNETKVTITKIAHSANKESFLVQSIVVKNHILKDLGLFAEAEGHEKEMKKVQADIDKYYQPEEAEQDQRTQHKYDKALEAYAKSEKLLEAVVKKMFDTFRSFIHESISGIFDDILASKVNTTPWVMLRGVEETKEELGYSLYAFEVVWIFWMPSVFQEDAAEATLEYLLYGIKKSRAIAPRIFVRRVKQLSNYIKYLPGAYYSSQATSQTTKTKKLTDPQVAQLALRLCPPAWKTAWKMLKKGMPQDLEEIVQFMELQESAEKSATAKAKAHNNNGSQPGKQAGSNKRKGNSGQNGGSSKKAKKHCELCDKHGGPASSHNTDDCRIYKADGTKKGQSRGEKKSNHSFAQLEKKLEKAEKKMTKMAKKMDRLSLKRPKEESDSDSDA
jgi:hypothetical protein